MTRYYAGGDIPGAPARNRAEEWDDAAQTYTAWSVSGGVTSQRAYTQEESAAAMSAAASATADANGTTIRSRAQQALTANATYLAIGSPTNAQVAAQVVTLTKESTAVIRLLLGLLDSTAGT